MALGRFLRGLLPGASSVAGSGPGGRTGPAGAGSPADGGAASAVAPSALRMRAWQELPPIQRTMTDAPLVAPTGPFRAALSMAHSVPTALAPLGHARGLDAPAGLVAGIAAPVQRDANPMPASVRSRGRGTRPGRAADGPASWSTAGSLEESASPGPGGLADALADAESPFEPVVPVLRVAPVVGAAAGSPSPASGSAPAPAPVLTRMASRVAVPGGWVGTARADASAASSPAASGMVVAEAGSAGRAGVAVSREAIGSPMVPSMAATSSASPPSATPTAAGGDPPRHVGAAPIRRLRIGAPITAIGGRPAMQRSWDRAAPGPEPVASSSLPPLPVAAGGTAPGGTPVLAREEADHGTDRAALAGSPGGEVPAPAREGIAIGTQPFDEVTAVERAAVPVPLRPVAVARHLDAPLVGTLRPMAGAASPAVAVHVQAERDGGAIDAPEPGSPAAALAALERIDAGAGIAGTGGFAGTAGAASGLPWGPAGPAPSAGRPGSPAVPRVGIGAAAAGVAMPVRPGPVTDGAYPPAPGPRLLGGEASSGVGRGRIGPAVVARSAATASVRGPLPVGAGMSWDPIHGLAGPGVQRAVPAVSSGPATPAVGSASWPPADAGSSASEGASASEGSSATGSTVGLPSLAPLVLREAADMAAGSAPRPGRAADGAGGTADAGAALAVEATAPAVAGAGAAAMPEAELDALARRLHERIATRLSHDLLVERERAGTLVDRGW